MLLIDSELTLFHTMSFLFFLSGAASHPSLLCLGNAFLLQ